MTPAVISDHDHHVERQVVEHHVGHIVRSATSSTTSAMSSTTSLRPSPACLHRLKVIVDSGEFDHPFR